MSEVTWVIPDRLARGYRPGRYGPPGAGAEVVAAWCESALEAGIRSILCLLAEEQLELYAGVPGGLLDYYRTRGFKVEHVPVADYKTPPLDHAELHKVWEAFRALPGSVLVHCSAGVDRTGAAIEHILEKLKAEESSEA